MGAYIVRRLLLGIPTVLGVLLFLFILFFAMANPDNIATRALGDKAKPEQIERWKIDHGYHLPKFINRKESGSSTISETQFFQYFKSMLTFDFGKSDIDNVEIMSKIKDGAGPSLFLSAPVFLIGLLAAISASLLVATFRGTYVDHATLVLCVIGMSIVYFLYIIGGQYLFGKVLHWFPISGWSDTHVLHFLLMPVVVGTVAGIAGNIRFYRTVMVNEVTCDYVRTARAKGLGDAGIMFKHLLKNAMIPILTNVVMALPFLFMGSLLLEKFFNIPGLGKLTVNAILNNDFPTVSAMVYVSSLIYIVANILTDLSYTLVDPRVRLK